MILAYERREDDRRIYIVLNFTAAPRSWPTPFSAKTWVALSTHGDRRGEAVGPALSLRANEGLIIEAI